jgi:hypothetical protein
MNAPHAIQSGFSYAEQNTLAYLEQAKQIIAEAREQNPMVRNILSTCEENGLVPIDQLRMLCANLLNQHNIATQTMIAMETQLKELKEHVNVSNMETMTRAVYGQGRRVIDTWRNANSDRTYVRCDDGTVWRLEPGAVRPFWVEEVALSAMIPQGAVL